ncbi:hypothetical protein FE784_03965 [Paenibacillus hemerocallicola]|uniref:Uncharacterized protein n=2 Tax=Paenibacillus hemerocallicola TaxID=1172614 RepID=A0A5C4TF36_9BACL|nr:hypothetical protein FE784_03965 [Paenibacillus hemerocallicola]
MQETNTMTRRAMLTSLGLAGAAMAAGGIMGGSANAVYGAGAADINIVDYGAVSGGVADASDAIQSAIDAAKGGLSGAVRFPKGRWKAKNIVVENCTLAFDDGAVLVLELGANDNGLLLRSNTRVLNATFEVTNTASPPDGNTGNVFRLGDYEAVAGEVCSDVRVYGAKLYCLNATRKAQAVEVLGQVNDFALEDIVFYGPFDAGIIVHWGGDVGSGDAHNKPVTYSYHPHDGVIRNIRFLPYNDIVGNYGIILSAVYDIIVENIVFDGWICPIRILPGDVYAQVAVYAEKHKVQTGIVIRDVEIGDPPARPANKASAPIFIQGSSATVRTPIGPTYTLDAISSIRISGVAYSLSPEKAYGGSPLILVYYSSGVSLEDVTAVGFESVGEYLALVEYSNDCRIAYTGATANGSRIYGCIGCTIDARTAGTAAAQTGGKTGLTAAGATFAGTLTTALALGATTMLLSAISPAVSVPRGHRIWLGEDKSVIIAKTTPLSATEANAVPIEPSRVSEAAGTAVAIKLVCAGLTVTGSFSKWEQGVMLSDVYGARIEADFALNGKYDVLLSGSRSDCIRIDHSRFEACGHKNDGSLMANIHLGTSGDRIAVTGCVFEPQGNPFLNRHIAGNAELSNVTISDNDFGGSALPAVAIGPQSAAASEKGKISIYGNTCRNGAELIAAGAIQGMYVGGSFQGLANAAPTTGYWRAGDSLANRTPAAGAPKGWRCTATGTPGTWVSEGNL